MSNFSRDLETNLNTSCVGNGPSLLSNLAPSFLLPIMINCNKSMIIKTQTLFDFGAFACFADKELMQQHKLTLVNKITPIGVEIIDNWSFSS